MIFIVSGKLDSIYHDFIVIEASGIGYQVYMPELMISGLPEIGEFVKVFTYHHIREDQQQLFGFLSLEDKRLFTLLISVSGLGPKGAIKILSAIQSGHLIKSIINNDIATIISIPGIGKKMAEKIIIELRDKLPKIYGDTASLSAGHCVSILHKSVDPDISMALKTLGYNDSEINKAFSKATDLLDSDMTLEHSLKVLLKHL
jgi:holliday junction DNA helicase RuvA